MKDMTPERHDHEHLVNEVNSLRAAFRDARDHIVPRPTITLAVQNYIANTLGLNRGDITKMIEGRIERAISDWFHQRIDQRWLRELISRVVIAELKPLVAGQFTVRVEPVVTVTSRAP